MNIDKDLNKNKNSEITHAIQTFNMGDSKNISAGTEIFTLLDLTQKYNICWNGYYKPSFERVQKLESIDLMNISEVRDYITFVVNKKYFEYCKRAKIKPTGMISIPEHMINSYKDFTLSLMSTKKDLVQLITKIVHRYIDNNGVVHDTCYGKQVNNALNDINLIKNNSGIGEKDFFILLPSYANDNLFEFRNVEINNTDDLNNTGSFKIEYINRQIETTEKMINRLIPKKYLSDSNVAVDNESCWKCGRGKKYREFYTDDPNYIVISTCTDYAGIIHEYIHSVLTNNWRKGKKEISLAISDFMFEITKGNPIHWVGDDEGKIKYYDFKVIDKDNLAKYSSYITKLYGGKELYHPDTEVLSMLMEELFINQLGINQVNLHNNLDYPIEDAIKINFNYMCDRFPEVGAFLLTFFRGGFIE